MITVNCFGIHSDDVGIRYLVQDTGVSNAHGMKDNPEFNVKTLVKTKCPHSMKIVNPNIPKRDMGVKHLEVFAPVPTETKVYRTDLSVEQLKYSSSMNGTNALMIPQWAITDPMLLKYMYASNITCTIITGIQFTHGRIVRKILNTRSNLKGKIVLQGSYLFPRDVPLITEVTTSSVNDPVKLGQQVMYNYLKETDG